MKTKHFYSHIITIDTLIVELNRLDLSKTEKSHLIELVDSQLHHAILDAILSELNEEEKKDFLTHLSSNSYSDIWQMLEKRIDKIEEKIKDTAESVKKELHEDIKEAKKI